MVGVGTYLRWESSADAAFTTPVSMGAATAIYADVSTGNITAYNLLPFKSNLFNRYTCFMDSSPVCGS